MQFTSTPKRTATGCLIAALVVLAMWFLGPVLTHFVAVAMLLAGVRPAWGGRLASQLFKGGAPS
jgi:multisubunit Na+/H+ antiporter MnhG subunit